MIEKIKNIFGRRSSQNHSWEKKVISVSYRESVPLSNKQCHSPRLNDFYIYLSEFAQKIVMKKYL